MPGCDDDDVSTFVCYNLSYTLLTTVLVSQTFSLSQIILIQNCLNIFPKLSLHA